MGLKSDISELTTVWRGSPWRVKLFLLLSGFLATSSIASLSESVAKWKGFFLAGVTLYRECFRDPVIRLTHDWTSLSLSPTYVDAVTAFGLMLAAYLRGLLFLIKNSTSQRLRLFALAMFALSATNFAWLVYHAATAGPDVRVSTSAPIVAYLVILAISLIPPRRAWDLLVTVYLLIPPLLVCIAAAINVGLN